MEVESLARELDESLSARKQGECFNVFISFIRSNVLSENIIDHL